MPYQDGTFTSAVQNGPKQIFYPFLNSPTKDTTTKGTIRNYVVIPNSYTPAAALSTDPDDATQYLVDESELAVESGVGRFARTYCKVPQQQIVPGTLALSKPTIPGNDAFPRNFGSYIIVQPDTTLEKYDAYKRTTVTNDSGVPGFYPTGGSYLLSFNSNATGSINYAANAATVQSSLNALSSIQTAGNVSVSGSYNSTTGFDVTFANVAAGSINVSSIVVSTDSSVSSSVTETNGGYSKAFEFHPSAGVFSNTTLAAVVSGMSSTPSGATIYGTFNYTNDSQGQGWNGGISSSGGYTLSGTFKLSAFGQTTSDITYSTNPATLKANIETAFGALSNVAARGNLRVTTPIFDSQNFSVNIYIDPKIVSGTFTLSLLSQTTSALNYNSNVATIQNAINALSNVQTRGTVVVTTGSGTSTILDSTSSVAAFSVGFSNNLITSNSVSLTPSGSSVNVVKLNDDTGRTQRILPQSATSTRTLYAAGHGIDPGETIFVRNAASVFANIAESKVTVIDSNTVQLSVASSDSWASVASITEIGSRTKQNYEPGSVVIRSKTTSDFYLPGVTAGITTAEDIPIPVDESGTAAFLQGVFSGQSAINVRVGELQTWRGPILVIDTTTVNAADV